MKLEAKNLGFCIKFFSYMVLFTQATFNASAGYVPAYTVFLFIVSYYVLNYVATLLYAKFYLGMDTPAIQFLQKRVASRLIIIYCFNCSGSHFSNYIIKTLPSDAESREDQDGSKQKFVGRTTANLWPFLPKCNRKHGRETKMKD